MGNFPNLLCKCSILKAGFALAGCFPQPRPGFYNGWSGGGKKGLGICMTNISTGLP